MAYRSDRWEHSRIYLRLILIQADRHDGFMLKVRISRIKTNNNSTLCAVRSCMLWLVLYYGKRLLVQRRAFDRTWMCFDVCFDFSVFPYLLLLLLLTLLVLVLLLLLLWLSFGVELKNFVKSSCHKRQILFFILYVCINMHKCLGSSNKIK